MNHTSTKSDWDCSWHAEIRSGVASAERTNSLPHAIMLSGGAGMGADLLADQLAALVLCESPSEDRACGQCKSCKLLQAGSHNDFIRLAPEEEGKQIKVDAVRSMVSFITESSMRGGHKVAVISPVEGLNINGANALLKTLEEPAGDTIIFLVAERQEAILPTIRSRCQIVNIPTPSREEAIRFLQQQSATSSLEHLQKNLAVAHGAPIKALEYVDQGALSQQEDMVGDLSEVLKRKATASSLASKWDDAFLSDRLEWLIHWLEQMIRFTLVKDESVFTHDKTLAMLRYLAEKNTTETLFELRSQHLREHRLLNGTTNPNALLLCESLILGWKKLMG